VPSCSYSFHNQPWPNWNPSVIMKSVISFGTSRWLKLIPTWAMIVAKELGQIEDFAIYRSQLENSGDVNLFLVVQFANSDQLDPNKAEYDKFMKAWGEANQKRSREITKNYPAMRKITGEYMVRKIDIK